MEAEDGALEDGELSNDSENYTPLERPTNYSTVLPFNRFPVKIQDDTESEDELQSSDTDSDSDNVHKKAKKPKFKLKPKLVQQKPPQKHKKYDIWSTRLQEEVLSANLDSCDVTTKDRLRDVESYDYTLAAKYYNNEENSDRKNNKRTRDDRKNNHFRPRKRSPIQEEKVKSTPRLIMDLEVALESSVDEIARDMANKLCEEREDLILKVIDVMGKEKTLEIFQETKRIEEEGGMLIMNQTRRRTPGGVFLFLVRNDYHITPEQRDSIFNEEKERHKKMLKQKQKMKNNKLKNAIAAQKSKELPDLMSRAELFVSNSNRERKDTGDGNVINPPPTPETDCHENSGDGMDNAPTNNLVPEGRNKLQSYDDDYLDIHCSNEMDLF